ncbi:zinc C3HC4 type domain-containing protein [Cryptosporidium andersoni]|uniref:Zinc C3HC4 type domain-containing protein n=1 Tax=Cryptosporidium andersoni TaxID=117008 RepID=A0A1J4MBK6_9CRYT|nr:zinc C3HC4 type domain-containing protein [Cryptosporidium andersoni]
MDKDKYQLNRECRFCFGAEDLYAPLITPCECRGTQAYIHLYCLCKWQKSQIDRPWSRKFCNICRYPYKLPPPHKILLMYSKSFLKTVFASITSVCAGILLVFLVALISRIIYGFVMVTNYWIHFFITILALLYTIIITLEFKNKNNTQR